MSRWKDFVSLLKRPSQPDPEVRVRDGGFDVVSPNRELRLSSVDWTTVDRVETYKVDLFATDCICLLFVSGDEAVEVSEDWIGFNALFESIKVHFPTIKDDWFGTVMQPPFEANRTVLFDRLDAA